MHHALRDDHASSFRRGILVALRRGSLLVLLVEAASPTQVFSRALEEEDPNPNPNPIFSRALEEEEGQQCSLILGVSRAAIAERRASIGCMGCPYFSCRVGARVRARVRVS